MVTAIVPYKRVDLAIEAFNRLGKSLLIVGDGQGMSYLKKRARKNIEFLGWQSDEKVRDYLPRVARPSSFLEKKILESHLWRLRPVENR